MKDTQMNILALPGRDAADKLGISGATLRRWVRKGCPVYRRGRRGRGCSALFDIDAIRRWRAATAAESPDHSPVDAALLEIAADVPHVIACAVSESWQQAEGIDKKRLAAIMAATWYVTSNAVLDRIREKLPSIPELTVIPEPVARMRKIASM